jgi:hypothetical protein
MKHYPAWQLAATAACIVIWLTMCVHGVRAIVNPDSVLRRQIQAHVHPWTRTRVRVIGVIYAVGIPAFLLWYIPKVFFSD